MHENAHPLRIQELIDRCISFAEPPDLCACALVSHSWVYAAQSHLFYAIHINLSTWLANEDRWMQLEETLVTSPHLIRHIQFLEIFSAQLSDDVFLALALFPFTHVHSIRVYHSRDLEISDAQTLRVLCRLPTLRRVSLECEFMDPAAFGLIWEGCSPSISHLNLDAQQRVYDPFETIPAPSSAPMPLQSLRIVHAECVGDWLSHDLCPFDISRLEVLSLRTNIELLRSAKFAPAFRTLETLDIQLIHLNTTAINLSAFSRLILLRISCHTPNPLPMILPILSTIVPTNLIHKIILVATLPSSDYEALDAALSGLPMSHTPVLELEMKSMVYAVTAPLLPRLGARNLLRRADYHYSWFERFIGML